MSNQGRRSFVKKVGLAAGFAALNQTSSWANIVLSSQNKKLGVALVGLGYYSTDLLAPALQRTSHCELRGIVTGSPDKIPRWQANYNIPDKNVYNYDNISSIANNDDIDVVYIVLPTGLHSRDAIKAANAGKHVWCEKPMARTTQQCQEIISACTKNKVKLSIGYRMQHEPNTQQVIAWSKSRPYGQLKKITAKAGYYDGRSNHWKQNKMLGGGAMYDMGVYPLNAIRYASGEEPVRVSGKHETSRPEIYTEVDETTHFELEFKSGLVASGSTSLGKGMNNLRVTAEDGWYELSPFQSYGGIKGKTSDGKVLNQYIPNQQAKQMDDDALAILNSRDVIVPGEEGLKDIRIVEAIYTSARLGKEVAL